MDLLKSSFADHMMKVGKNRPIDYFTVAAWVSDLRASGQYVEELSRFTVRELVELLRY